MGRTYIHGTLACRRRLFPRHTSAVGAALYKAILPFSINVLVSFLMSSFGINSRSLFNVSLGCKFFRRRTAGLKEITPLPFPSLTEGHAGMQTSGFEAV